MLPCKAGLVETIAMAKRSVVVVGTYNPVNSPRFAFRGTGFVVGDGNSLITSFHVLPDAAADGQSKLTVQLPVRPGELEMRPATVAATDRVHDLALLHFDGSPLPALRTADTKGVQEGLSVAFIGFPIGDLLGLTPVTHRGIVSSIAPMAIARANSQLLNERTVRTLRDGGFDIYQLDATAYPGNSGGPVFNAETGEVIGVIDMVLVRDIRESPLGRPTGITYAIPGRFVDELLRGK